MLCRRLSSKLLSLQHWWGFEKIVVYINLASSSSIKFCYWWITGITVSIISSSITSPSTFLYCSDKSLLYMIMAESFCTGKVILMVTRCWVRLSCHRVENWNSSSFLVLPVAIATAAAAVFGNFLHCPSSISNCCGCRAVAAVARWLLCDARLWISSYIVMIWYVLWMGQNDSRNVNMWLMLNYNCIVYVLSFSSKFCLLSCLFSLSHPFLVSPNSTNFSVFALYSLRSNLTQ